MHKLTIKKIEAESYLEYFEKTLKGLYCPMTVSTSNNCKQIYVVLSFLLLLFIILLKVRQNIL